MADTLSVKKPHFQGHSKTRREDATTRSPALPPPAYSNWKGRKYNKLVGLYTRTHTHKKRKPNKTISNGQITDLNNQVTAQKNRERNKENKTQLPNLQNNSLLTKLTKWNYINKIQVESKHTLNGIHTFIHSFTQHKGDPPPIVRQCNNVWKRNKPQT